MLGTVSQQQVLDVHEWPLCTFQKLHGPNKQIEQKEVRKPNGLIYLAVKAVAPLCLLLLLIPWSLSKAIGWQRKDLHAKGHLNAKFPGFSLPDMQNQRGAS